MRNELINYLRNKEYKGEEECFICGNKITEERIVVDNNYYHLQCFANRKKFKRFYLNDNSVFITDIPRKEVMRVLDKGIKITKVEDIK